MAEQDMVVMGTTIYWFRERHYRRMQNVANDALRKYSNEPVLKLLCALGMMMESRMTESMRELEVLSNKQDVNLAAVIALIYGHRQARAVDQEAVQQLDAKLKAERKQGKERSYYYAGLLLMHLEQYDKAAEYIDRAVKLNPQSKDILALKGWHELGNGKETGVRRALKYFDESLSMEGQVCIDAMFGKARCLQKLNDYNKAIDIISKAIVKTQNSLPALLEKMKIQLAMNDWEQAIDTANRAIAIDKGCLLAHQFIILQLLCKDGNYAEAASKLEELSNLFTKEEPQNARLLTQFAKLFCRLSGQNALILQQTYALQEKAVSLNTNNPDSLCELGYQLLTQSRPKDAIKCYQNAYKADDLCISALVGIIWCQVVDNQIESAISQLEFLNETKDSVSAEVAYLTAMVSVKREEPQEKTIALLNSAVKTHAEGYQSMQLGTEYLCALNPNFLLQIAEIYMTFAPQQPLTKDQAPDRVLTDCQKILDPLCKAVPGLMQGLFLLGKVRFLAGDNDSANSLVQRCLKMDPTVSDSHILMAQIHLSADNFKMASESLEQGLSYNFEVREHPVYLLIRARILKKQGNLDEAIKTLQAAMALPGIKYFGSGGGNNKKKTKVSTSDAVSLYIELADAHRLRNEQHEAAKVMQDAANNFSGTSEQGRLTVANVDLMLARGDVETALTALQTVTPEQANYIQAQEKMANIYLNHRKDKHLYTSCYRELAKRFPSPHTYQMLGDAYMSVHEPEKAIDTYETSLKRNPRDATMASKIGLALVKTHQFAKAVSYYEAAFKQSGQLFLRHDLTRLLIRLKQYEKAEKFLKQFIDQEANGNLDSLIETSRFLVLLSQVYQQVGRQDDWLNTLTKAVDAQSKVMMRVSIDQPDITVQQQMQAADIYSRLGQYHLQRRDLQQALQCYKDAYSYWANDAKVVLELAKLYMLTDDLDSCETLCQQMKKQGLEVEEAAMLMADVLLRKKLYDDALQQFQQLLQSKPNHYGALERLINLLRRAGRLEDCPKFISLAEKSSSRAALDAGFVYCKGLYEWYTGNPNAALRYFNKARKDSQYGHSASYCMVEICLNPDNETIGGELFDGGESERGPGATERADAEQVGIRTADRLLKELKPSPTTITQHTILTNMVLIATKHRNNVETALASFMQMCNTEKDNYGALYGSAVACLALKDSQKARHQLHNIAKAPWTFEDADALEKSWLLLADMNIQSGRNDLAGAVLERCLQHNRSCCKAFEYLGYIMEKEQKYEEAMANYELAWRYGNKSNPAIGYKLAFNYLKVKKFVDAIDVCHQVLAAHPTYPKIRKEILEKARVQLRG